MGALHEGHLSLVRMAAESCDTVVVSIFVNPTQFDNADDLKRYPRTLERDAAKLGEAIDEVIIFAPQVEEIYGDNPDTESFEFGELETKMEGAFRKGHFDGVGTILKKLFDMVRPSKAFFGEKDYQQLMIVKKLVEILELPIEVVGCPISREESGLARSSRNELLSEEEKEKAVLLYQSLLWARENFGIKSATGITEKIKSDFENNPSFKLDYFEIADAETLEHAELIEEDRKYRAFVAAFMGSVRLIDNMALN